MGTIKDRVTIWRTMPPRTPRHAIGRAIASRRAYLGTLTQSKLAQRVTEAYSEYYGGTYPVTRQFISKVERGMTSLPAELLLPMAIALQLSNPFDLLSGTDQYSSHNL